MFYGTSAYRSAVQSGKMSAECSQQIQEEMHASVLSSENENNSQPRVTVPMQF